MTEDRMQTIRDIWRSNQGLYVVAGMFIGIIFNVLLVDRLLHYRIKQASTRNLQESLAWTAGSRVNSVATRAVDEIRWRGWIGQRELPDRTFIPTIGILKGRNLSFANLKDANLTRASLQDTHLSNTNLSNATLYYANLTGAFMAGTNLEKAYLRFANLTNVMIETTKTAEADFEHAILRKADLQYCDFKGANFKNSDMSNANLAQVNFSNANLENANLYGANLGFSNLSGTNLSDANLTNVFLAQDNFTGAILTGCDLSDAVILEPLKLDATTILPDGSRWSSNRTLNEFGIEDRIIISPSLDDEVEDDSVLIPITFDDNVTRRYQLHKGWLDDKDGKPISHLEGSYDKVQKRWIITYTYPNDTQRRWTYTTGWLDDENGNPING